MKEIIALLVLFGSGIGIGMIFGALLEEFHIKQAEPDPPSCENCIHGDLEWDEEPCDTCHDHCAWEAITNEKNEPIHFCNTCRHADKPTDEEPCKSCVPAKFGGKDKWEERK